MTHALHERHGIYLIDSEEFSTYQEYDGGKNIFCLGNTKAMSKFKLNLIFILKKKKPLLSCRQIFTHTLFFIATLYLD